MSPPPSAAGPPPGSEEPPVPSELSASPPSWPGLDRLGLTQAIGGLALGLIALFSSYDHLTFAGQVIPIPQQWGIPLIAASVAIVFVDAELASGSRLRAADETARERDRAAEARERAAEAAERQGQATARQDRCALLSARVLLDPSDSNRARLQAFLSLIAGERPPEQGGVG
ncbi:MAG: hypothetical protein NTW51_00690 [Cyanobacteria bacterium]|nr:hypothetical protein [Cyanobacteriota bacterium]